MPESSKKNTRTPESSAPGGQAPAGKRTRRRHRSTRGLTRDRGLLVSDKDILSFVGHLKSYQIVEVAGRFDAIANIVFEDLHTDPAGKTLIERIAERVPLKIPKIHKIARESRARDYRKITAAIEEGVRAGDGFSARRTAEAVVEELFQYTPFYSRAMEEFCLSVRAVRKKRE